MLTAQEFNDRYDVVRSTILGQFFAFDASGRANLISIFNDRQEHPGSATLTQWDVAYRDRDNALLWSAKLLTALAVEHHLGDPNAQDIIRLALATLEALFPFTNGDAFDGYMVRFDAGTSSPNPIRNGTEDRAWPAAYGEQFLIDRDAGGFAYAPPPRDPRHAVHRIPETLTRLLTDAQRVEYERNQDRYGADFRGWEPSADEMVGMLCALSAVHELVAVEETRGTVAGIANRLGDYLAANGYLLVRPTGGLTFRGPSSLHGLEYAVEQAFARITGISYASRTTVVGSLQRAGLWRVLQGPVERQILLWTAAAGALPAVLGPIIAADPTGITGILLTNIVRTATSAAPALAPTTAAALPLLLRNVPFAYGLYNHRDALDMDESGRLEAVVLPALLEALSPHLRMEVYVEILSTPLGGRMETSKSFLPYVAMSAIADPAHGVAQTYLRAMDRERARPSNLGRPDVLQSCFASAVALLLGAPVEEEARLVERLSVRHDQAAELVDGSARNQHSALGLDYLAGVSLAWLYAKRRTDAGDPITTPGFPVPPSNPVRPSVTVPEDIIAAVPAVRDALGFTAATLPNVPVDVFGPDVPRVKADVLPEPPDPAVPALLTDTTVLVRDVDGDVDSGVVLEPGQEFEVTATGSIVAPELFAGSSDANGWDHLVDDARFALHTAIDPQGARKYALLGRLNGYFFVGTARARQRWDYPEARRLYLRVNNDDHRLGAGNGAFDVRVKVWGKPPPAPPGTVQVVDLLMGDELSAAARLGAHFAADEVSGVLDDLAQGVGVVGELPYSAAGADASAVAALAADLDARLRLRAFVLDPILWTSSNWLELGRAGEAAAFAAANQLVAALTERPSAAVTVRLVSFPAEPLPNRLFVTSGGRRPL